MHPILGLRLPGFALTVAMLACAPAGAQEMNPALKELAAAANREGTSRSSWSQSSFGGSQGAALFQAAMNKAFGTNIRVNFLPGPDMARVVNQVGDRILRRTEGPCGHRARRRPADRPGGESELLRAGRLDQQYLPGRITPEMIELDGQIIRIVTGLSGVTYNSQLAPMKPTVLDDFLKPEWKGKIASTPYAAGLDVLLAEDVWGRRRPSPMCRALARSRSPA